MKPVLKKIATFLMLIALFSSSQSFSSDNEVDSIELDKNIEKERKLFFNKLVKGYEPKLNYDSFCSTLESCLEEENIPQLSAITAHHLSSFVDVSVRRTWSITTNDHAVKINRISDRSICENPNGVSLRYLRLFVDSDFNILASDYKQLHNKNKAFALIKGSLKRNRESPELFDIAIKTIVLSK